MHRCANHHIRKIEIRTFFQFLDALECDFKLERIQKRRGIVENSDVCQLNLGHDISHKFEKFKRQTGSQQIRRDDFVNGMCNV